MRKNVLLIASGFLIGFVVLLVGYVVLVTCLEGDGVWLVNPNNPDRRVLVEAHALYAALLLYADEHQGKFPTSLEELKPQYLGSSVDVKNYWIDVRKAMWNETNYNTVIVGRGIQTAEGKKTVIVSGKGYVSIQGPSD
jgi:hypothetical protein